MKYFSRFRDVTVTDIAAVQKNESGTKCCGAARMSTPLTYLQRDPTGGIVHPTEGNEQGG